MNDYRDFPEFQCKSVAVDDPHFQPRPRIGEEDPERTGTLVELGAVGSHRDGRSLSALSTSAKIMRECDDPILARPSPLVRCWWNVPTGHRDDVFPQVKVSGGCPSRRSPFTERQGHLDGEYSSLV